MQQCLLPSSSGAHIIRSAQQHSLTYSTFPLAYISVHCSLPNKDQNLLPKPCNQQLDAAAVDPRSQSRDRVSRLQPPAAPSFFTFHESKFFMARLKPVRQMQTSAEHLQSQKSHCLHELHHERKSTGSTACAGFRPSPEAGGFEKKDVCLHYTSALQNPSQ